MKLQEPFEVTQPDGRKIVYIDVGNMSPKDAERYMKRVMAKFKKAKV